MNAQEKFVNCNDFVGSVKAALKVTDPRRRTQSAVSCHFLRNSPVFCKNLWLAAPFKCLIEFPGEEVNLRKSAFWAQSVTLGLSPKAHPDLWHQQNFEVLKARHLFGAYCILKLPAMCDSPTRCNKKGHSRGGAPPTGQFQVQVCLVTERALS